MTTIGNTTNCPRRRVSWDVSGVIVLLTCLLAPCAADDVGIRVETFTYKTVGDLEIKAVMHRADDEARRPLVVGKPRP